MTTAQATDLLKFVDNGQFKDLFEELGWAGIGRGAKTIHVDFGEGREYEAVPVADQSGLRVWVVESERLADASEQRAIDAEVQKVSQVHLLIFTDGTNQSWRWPRRGATAATNKRLLHHHYRVGDEEMGMDLQRRLEMIELPVGKKLGILEIQELMAAAFNEEAVKRSQQASNHMEVMNQELLDCGASVETASSLLVRLLFLFFGDDTDMWVKDAFRTWILNHTSSENLNVKLNELFRVLCDPELDLLLGSTQSGRYKDSEFKNFRRIGGMYEDEVDLPPLTEEFRQQILKASDFDWAKVNPDIFGAMFQQLVDLEELHEHGEHYTSEENIMKVLEPMFLGELRDRFEAVRDDYSALVDLQNEMSSLQFLDPACGCGNFLIQAYKHLRGLEYEIISRLEEIERASIIKQLDEYKSKRKTQKRKELEYRLQEIESGGAIHFDEGILRKSKLSMQQFFGIEINQWPSKVAATAMLLVDHLCNQAWGANIVRLPIEETPNIEQANALRVDWGTYLDKNRTIYVFGNPPFVGYDDRTSQQLEDLKDTWGTKTVGRLDYVTAWFKKAVDFFAEGFIGDFAFVSTNSVTQGEPVVAMFEPIFSAGWHIRFAYQSFVWESELVGGHKAAVHCVIICFTQNPKRKRTLFKFDRVSSQFFPNDVRTAINAYLIDGPEVLIKKSSSKTVSPNLPELKNGCVAGDTARRGDLKGLPGLVMSAEEANGLISADPSAKRFLRPFVGGQDFLKGVTRYCLWLSEEDSYEARENPEINMRLNNVQRVRAASTEPSTQLLSEKPWKFKHIAQPTSEYICMPRTVSEDRDYFALGYLPAQTIVSNGSFWALDPTKKIFSLGSSKIFLAWQLAVGGRIKSDPRFANTLVWNTFPLPELSSSMVDSIIQRGEEVLSVRANYQDETLVSLYNRKTMPKELLLAHQALDAVVDTAFGLTISVPTMEQRQQVLFEHYEKLINGLK